MKEIYLTSHQKLLAPLELSNELNLIKPVEEIKPNDKIGYLLLGSLITITAIFIIINRKLLQSRKEILL